MAQLVTSGPPIHVECPWEVSNQKNLRDVVTVTSVNDYQRNEGGLTEMVCPETCVCLFNNLEEDNGNNISSNKPCSITLKLDRETGAVITSIVVVSEARIIEVFGAYQEYLTTVAADFLYEQDDMIVYCAEIELGHLTNECSVRFARAKKVSELWLYGIRVIWKLFPGVCEAKGHPASTINLIAVDKRLKDTVTPLSRKAEKCKEFIKLYGSLTDQKKFHSNSIGLNTILAMTGNERTTTSIFGDSDVKNQPIIVHKEDNVRKFYRDKMSPFTDFCLSNNLPVVVTQETPVIGGKNTVSESSSDPCVKGHDCNKCIQSYEILLNKSLQSLEKRLLQALDERMAILHQRQERQITELVDSVYKHALVTVGNFNGKLSHETESALTSDDAQTLSSKINECRGTVDFAIPQVEVKGPPFLPTKMCNEMSDVCDLTLSSTTLCSDGRVTGAGNSKTDYPEDSRPTVLDVNRNSLCGPSQATCPELLERFQCDEGCIDDCNSNQAVWNSRARCKE